MIDGNITLTLHCKGELDVSPSGEQRESWQPYKNLWGWLDLSTGTTNYNTYNAKIAESSHVFICDYTPIDKPEKELKAYVNGVMYDVNFIDDPMNLHDHLEIFLNKVE